METTKPFYLSKTIWVNVIAFIVLIAQSRFGFIINAEEQIGLLAVINLILRIITDQPLRGLPKEPESPNL